jgi:hypothetical protein
VFKLISRPGCEKIVRYAFEYAAKNNRKNVTCFVKDNIMKQTDGLFHRVFDEIGAEYPDIEKGDWIVDIGAAKLATAPEMFDVIVMPNLYGDILSDVTAQMTGSVGLAGSANIGEHVSMFEAIHGSAPRRAGQIWQILRACSWRDYDADSHQPGRTSRRSRTTPGSNHRRTAFTPTTFSVKARQRKSRHARIRRSRRRSHRQKPETLKAVEYKVIEESGETATKPLYTAQVGAKKICRH